MSVGVFLTVGEAVEKFEGRVLSDLTTLGKNGVPVLNKAEWFDGVILFDVVRRRKELVELSAAVTGRLTLTHA